MRLSNKQQYAEVLQPVHKRIILENEELSRYYKWIKNHTHPKQRAVSIEEDCAPGSGIIWTYTESSIGWWWKVKCEYCGNEEALSQDIDF